MYIEYTAEGLRMKTLIVYGIIVGCALSVGVAGGVIYKRMSGEEVDYGDFDANALELDAAQTLASYEKYNGYNPQEKFTPAELITIGLEKYRRCEYSYSVGLGVAETVVDQSIRNFQIRNGDDYFEESISKSDMVKLADRVTQHGQDGDIVIYRGEAKTDEVGSYPLEGKTYDQQSYIDYLGKTLNQMFIYIISNVTVIDGNVEKTSDGYNINVELSPDYATFHYKYQMLNISGLDELPVFNYVKLHYTFDKDMMLKTLSVDEEYKAKMGIKVNIKNKIDYKYFPNQKMEIPKLDKPIDYSIGR